MKRLALFLVLFAFVQQAAAAGIVRVADGDCAALSAAAASPRGSEPSLILLAPRGFYGYCPLTIPGNITIDGAGATLGVRVTLADPAIAIADGGSLNLREVNFVQDGDTTSCIPAGFIATCNSSPPSPPLVANKGTLVLDSVSATGVVFGQEAFVQNFGTLLVRNSTLVSNLSTSSSPLVALHGAASRADIENSTLAVDTSLFDCEYYGQSSDIHCAGQLTVSNSIFVLSSGSGLCSNVGRISLSYNIQPTSLGGNIATDDSCGLNGPNDRVAADVRFANFGDHGGVVGTQALAYNSAAIGNGIAANCEATDARGAARGQNHCDSGAYEFGGGQGRLAASGFTGLYYDAAHDGHYVTVQRLNSESALVVWNTFNQEGMPAWVFGVGTTNGNQIHVAQASQNLGGTLHPGGVVTGASPVPWGSLDFNVSNCYSATLNYQSTEPVFGSGSVDMTRIVFVEGLDCSD